MLREWIAPLDVSTFVGTYLQRAAWAQPHSASASKAVLDWAVLDEVLANQPDTIVCARGEFLPLPPPRDVIELRGYLRIGVGVCLRHTERHHPSLARVAETFERELDRAAQVQIFVTPGGTHGFGWHYDDEDVFIAQTAGVKEYYFRENTVERDTPFPPNDFTAFSRETSQLQSATLVPGDFLYLPARWWHMAICRQDALSISVGVTSSGTSRRARPA